MRALPKGEKTPIADREEAWLKEEAMSDFLVKSFVRPFITRIDEFLATTSGNVVHADGSRTLNVVIGDEEEIDIIAGEQTHPLGRVMKRRIEIIKESERIEEDGEFSVLAPYIQKHVIEVSLGSINMTSTSSGSYFRYQLFEEPEGGAEEKSIHATVDYRNQMEAVSAIEQQLEHITESLAKKTFTIVMVTPELVSSEIDPQISTN
jgi:hypothetical protein